MTVGNAGSPRHDRVTPLLLLLGLIGVLVLAGCRDENQPAPVATLASPTAAEAAAEATPTPIPDGTALLAASQAVLEGISSFSTTVRVEHYSRGGGEALAGERQARYVLDSAAGNENVGQQWREVIADDIEEETVCLGIERLNECYSRVNDYSWFRNYTLQGEPAFLEWRRKLVDAATVTETVTIADGATFVVEWTANPFPDVTESTLRGRSWLQASNLRPQREVIGLYQNGKLRYREETSYDDYGEAAGIELPLAATVTPAPTVAAPPATFTVSEEEAPYPGVLYVPEGQGPFPAAVILHGSEGGVRYSSEVAERLAQGGAVAFALCYFGCPGTPETLENINVEIVMDAVDYLQARPDTIAEEVSLVGLSRGAELSLIVGTLEPEVSAVVSVMGSPFVFDYSGDTDWLYQNEPLPFLMIPIEEIAGPVLLLHGEKDALWPVSYSYLLAERLEAHDHDYELMVYPRYAHELGVRPRDVINRTLVFLSRATD